MRGKKLLMIPGPIEFTPEVLEAIGQATTSHLDPAFMEAFGRALERMRQLFACPSGQPLVLAGSGTLAMDTAAANLVEPGDKALVVNTGYFGDRFAAILERYEAQVTHVCAPVPGDVPALAEVEAALRGGQFKLMTITQVDTSTGVLVDVKSFAALGRQYGALVVVDGVCSVAGEELRQEEWGVDLALTASQKAVGVPPGLALVVIGPRALETFRARKSPVRNYYADWTEWLPIMEGYLARQPRYFGTPAVNLVWALDVSLGQILAEGLETRWARHRQIGAAFQAAIAALGLSQVPVRPELAAHTMTAPYYPEGTDASLVGRIRDAGAVLAGGLLPSLRTRYFRIGHMGAVDASDTLATVGAIERGLAAAGYRFERGAGVAAAEKVLGGV